MADGVSGSELSSSTFPLASIRISPPVSACLSFFSILPPSASTSRETTSSTSPGVPKWEASILPESEMANARELLAHWFELMREQAPTRKAFLGQLGAVASHSTGRRLSTIASPTRVVTGDEDRLIPPRNSELLAARIPGAELEVLPGVAHAIPLIDREVVRRHAIPLLREAGG